MDQTPYVVRFSWIRKLTCCRTACGAPRYRDDTSDNWSAYWYEGPGLGSDQFPVYGTDGVEDPPTGEGFQVFSVLSDVTTASLAYLNPQTQERTLGGHGSKVTASKAGRYRSAPTAKARADVAAGSSQEVVRHLAP